MSLASLSHSQSTLGKPNFDSIIERLMKLDPAQRQQFAQLHADDPLMLSAAKYADSEIKKIDQAYLAKQSGTAPPKVNEQVVQAIGQPVQPPPQPQGQPQGQPPPPPPQGQPQAAQALPENSGIAQLPAPNLAKMAGGGIVAFSGEGESLVRSQNGGQDYFLDVPATIRDPSVPYYREIPNPKADLANRKFGSRAEAVLAYDTGGNPSGGPHPRLAQSTDPLASVPTQTTLPPTGAGAGQGTGGAPAPKVVSADVLAERLAAGKAPAGSAQPPMPTIKNTSDSDILATYQRIQKDINPDVTVDPYAAQTEANRADAASVGQRQLSDATAREQGLAALLSKREGRIQEREGRIQGAEDLNTKMSIINAGLAMMQSTGKGLAGIAEGATVGARQYGEGKKATELARQKIEDARDAFDELRFNQEGMTAKEKTAAVAAITSASITARTAAVKNMQDKQGLTAKQATDLFDNTIKAQLEKQRMENQLKLEAMQQGGANARTATQEAGANARTDKQIASQVTKFNPMTSYADYLKGFAGKETITPPMSYADYVAQFAPPKMVNVPDANLKP